MRPGTGGGAGCARQPLRRRAWDGRGRSALAGLLFLLLLAPAPRVSAQELAHLEGYLINSAQPAVNPNSGVIGLEGRGLVTALYPPIVSNFVANEYTWVLKGLVPLSNVTVGSTTYTTYDTTNSSLILYQDALQDARPTFYECPADIGPSPPGDSRYSDGTVFYVRWHFKSFTTMYDSNTGSGTFYGTPVPDPGQPYRRYPCFIVPGDGPLNFGGEITTALACIPTASGYDQALTGRLYCLYGCCALTPAPGNSWGKLRRLYH